MNTKLYDLLVEKVEQFLVLEISRLTNYYEGNVQVAGIRWSPKKSVRIELNTRACNPLQHWTRNRKRKRNL